MLRYIKTGETANVVVIRKVANTIRDSVFNKIWWALNLFGAGDKFKRQSVRFKSSTKKQVQHFISTVKMTFKSSSQTTLGIL